jgi:hypothetical protein
MIVDQKYMYSPLNNLEKSGAEGGAMTGPNHTPKPNRMGMRNYVIDETEEKKSGSTIASIVNT